MRTRIQLHTCTDINRNSCTHCCKQIQKQIHAQSLKKSYKINHKIIVCKVHTRLNNKQAVWLMKYVVISFINHFLIEGKCDRYAQGCLLKYVWVPLYMPVKNRWSLSRQSRRLLQQAVQYKSNNLQLSRTGFYVLDISYCRRTVHSFFMIILVLYTS